MNRQVGFAHLRSRRGSPLASSSAADRATAPYSRPLGVPVDRRRVATLRPVAVTSLTSGSRAKWRFHNKRKPPGRAPPPPPTNPPPRPPPQAPAVAPPEGPAGPPARTRATSPALRRVAARRPPPPRRQRPPRPQGGPVPCHPAG